MYRVEDLAVEESRHKVEMAENAPGAQGAHLRRARRMEQRAERRMFEAWRRAAELRGTLESMDH